MPLIQGFQENSAKNASNNTKGHFHVFSSSDALLADLQNTVPGKLKPIPAGKPHNVTFSDDASNGAIPGYGSRKVNEPVSQFIASRYSETLFKLHHVY